MMFFLTVFSEFPIIIVFLKILKLISTFFCITFPKGSCRALFPGDLKPVPGNVVEIFLPSRLWFISAGQQWSSTRAKCLCPEEPWEFCLQRTFCPGVLTSPSSSSCCLDWAPQRGCLHPPQVLVSAPSMAWGLTASSSVLFPWVQLLISFLLFSAPPPSPCFFFLLKTSSVYLCMRMFCAPRLCLVSVKAKRGCQIPEPELQTVVTRCVGAGNQIQVLCKSSKFSYPLPPPSSPFLFFDPGYWT